MTISKFVVYNNVFAKVRSKSYDQNSLVSTYSNTYVYAAEYIDTLLIHMYARLST